MAETPAKDQPFNIMIVAQAGRLQYEAVLFAASLRQSDTGFKGRLIVAEPQPGPLWSKDPRIDSEGVRTALADLGAEIVPFENRHFGDRYLPGNKIEGLSALPADAPFVFFDTDTLITGPLSDVPFDFDRPCASLRREDTWPEPPLYGPGYHEIWKSLYDRFGLDIGPTIDESQPLEYWKRYMYFNAGWFFYKDPQAFRDRMLDYALSIRDDTPEELASQALYPWLDQIVLPLVIHSFGGARQTIPGGLLDGSVSCHYRVFPLLYAREADAVVEVLETVAAPNKVKKVLKEYDPMRRMIFQNKGQKVRALFDRDHLPAREQMIRNKIKRARLWLR